MGHVFDVKFRTRPSFEILKIFSYALFLKVL